MKGGLVGQRSDSLVANGLWVGVVGANFGVNGVKGVFDLLDLAK